MSQSVILCEGFHDRAFWAGWLAHLGCVDPGAPVPGKKGRAKIFDPFGKTVAKGHYAYFSKSNQFIRIEPCGGKSEVLPAADVYLSGRATAPVKRLVINIDSDVTASGKPCPPGLQLTNVEAFARRFDPAATTNSDGEIELDGGATRIALIRWDAADPPTPGLPDQQTLERLVSAALATAYPARASALQYWLDTRPEKPGADPKEHAWSYMAGWYADHGCEAFYLNLWNDPKLVAELQSRLTSSGAWQVAEKLAQ